jgi:hypothetical protein
MVFWARKSTGDSGSGGGGTHPGTDTVEVKLRKSQQTGGAEQAGIGIMGRRQGRFRHGPPPP